MVDVQRGGGEQLRYTVIYSRTRNAEHILR